MLRRTCRYRKRTLERIQRKLRVVKTFVPLFVGWTFAGLLLGLYRVSFFQAAPFRAITLGLVGGLLMAAGCFIFLYTGKPTVFTERLPLDNKGRSSFQLEGNPLVPTGLGLFFLLAAVTFTFVPSFRLINNPELNMWHGVTLAAIGLLSCSVRWRVTVDLSSHEIIRRLSLAGVPITSRCRIQASEAQPVLYRTYFRLTDDGESLLESFSKLVMRLPGREWTVWLGANLEQAVQLSQTLEMSQLLVETTDFSCGIAREQVKDYRVNHSEEPVRLSTSKESNRHSAPTFLILAVIAIAAFFIFGPRMF